MFLMLTGTIQREELDDGVFIYIYIYINIHKKKIDQVHLYFFYLVNFHFFSDYEVFWG